MFDAKLKKNTNKNLQATYRMFSYQTLSWETITGFYFTYTIDRQALSPWDVFDHDSDPARDIFTATILQMGKSRLSEIKQLDRGHSGTQVCLSP